MSESTHIVERDVARELEMELHRIARRGAELHAMRPSPTRDEKLEELRAEYRRVHERWVFEKNQLRLF